MTVDLKKMEEDLTKEFTSYRKEKDEYMEGLNVIMRNVSDLANRKHEIYRERHRLVSKKFSLMNRVAELSKLHKEQEREIIRAIKMGRKIVGFEDSDLVPKNDFERKAFMENFLKELEMCQDLLNNYLTFVTDTIETIDRMLYGVGYVIQLESMKSHIME